ncbi:hypothetical protein D9M68_975020 [compost metagenome]
MDELIDGYTRQAKRFAQVTAAFTTHVDRDSHHRTTVIPRPLIPGMSGHIADDVGHHLSRATAHAIHMHRMLAEQGFR